MSMIAPAPVCTPAGSRPRASGSSRWAEFLSFNSAFRRNFRCKTSVICWRTPPIW